MSRVSLLPIDAHIPKILEAIARANLVLKASPGSGKTTRVPAALLRNLGPDQEVLVLEPRRIAAKMAAERVAFEDGTPIGEKVGYQFRFENRSGPRTRLRFLTEGTFLKRLLRDPKLAKVAVVVLDEFHERHLQTDLALSLLRNLQQKSRPDLRILLMSATLDTRSVEAYLGGESIEVEAPRHPVEMEYLLEAPKKHLELLVKHAVEVSLRRSSGHVLVFLPGLREIRRCESELGALARRDKLLLCPLHGSLSRDEQDLALEPNDRRKIILSTNIAESSVTIDGVTAVVDSGFHRQASVNSGTGIATLVTQPISRASAVQRAGRAGRTGPGFCFRLYTSADFSGRTEFERPEIERSDLTQAYLELAKGGWLREDSFAWFAAPPVVSWESAGRLLDSLAAVQNGVATELGARIAEFPLHPRWSVFLVLADQAGFFDEAVEILLYVTEGNFKDADLWHELETFRPAPLSLRMRDQLQSLRQGRAAKNALGAADKRKSLARLLLRAFADRVAMKRPGNDEEFILSGGSSARLPKRSHPMEGDFFVVLDLQENRESPRMSRSEIKSLVAIEESWLFDSGGVQEESELSWDSERQRLKKKSCLRYGRLTLAEDWDALSEDDRERAFPIFLQSFLKVDRQELRSFVDLVAAVEKVQAESGLESTLARVELYASQFASDFARPFNLENFWSYLSEGMGSNMNAEAFRSLLEPSSISHYFLSPSALAAFARRLPTEIALPSGKKARIHYLFGQAPWLESRLQDFFGWNKGPSLLEGRLSVVLKLLAPNYRPVQVTTDLEGFWERAYQEIRGELSRRYPRHKWPVDPRSGT